MENLFIGFRSKGQLYGAKSYVENDKEWDKADEMVRGFFNRNSLLQMKELFDSIFWESIASNKRINNGFTFMALLKEDTIDRYAYYRQEVDKKISKKGKKETPLYDSSIFLEKEGKILAIFKNHGEIFDEYEFVKTYILDLDTDELNIENHKTHKKEQLKRATT